MYGVPKIHKSGVPLRPILSMSGSPQYAVSQWLCSVLEPVLLKYGSHCVKDSFTFCQELKDAQLPMDGFMCSFDVVSLFTNAPLDIVIDICAKSFRRFCWWEALWGVGRPPISWCIRAPLLLYGYIF